KEKPKCQVSNCVKSSKVCGKRHLLLLPGFQLYKKPVILRPSHFSLKSSTTKLSRSLTRPPKNKKKAEQKPSSICTVEKKLLSYGEGKKASFLRDQLSCLLSCGLGRGSLLVISRTKLLVYKFKQRKDI
ncbi:hypothetical protein PRUPE_8G042100, partial [Prunus persica]